MTVVPCNPMLILILMTRWKTITEKVLMGMMKYEQHFILISVMARKEYMKGHIPGSINIPVVNGFNHIMDAIVPDKNETIVVYGEDIHCKDTERACRKLVALEYNNVLCFLGGLKRWDEAGNPIRCEEEVS